MIVRTVASRQSTAGGLRPRGRPSGGTGQRHRRRLPRHHRQRSIGVSGGGMGKGGNVTLYCDGKDVGEGRVDQTQGVIFSADETTDIGRETRQLSAPTTPRTPAGSTARSTGYKSTSERTPRTPITTSTQMSASGSPGRGSSPNHAAGRTGWCRCLNK